MYYSSGNYESFARPRKPAGVDEKTAWFVGAGLASMASAVFMIRDGQMSGKNITILERLRLPGGALDGIKAPEKGFVIRGGREMEDHMECLWDLFRTIPSLEVDGSVLDDIMGATGSIASVVRDLRVFARADGDSLPSDRGAGIGLALAKRLAQLHQGDLSVASEGEDRGTTFTLTLAMGA